MLPLRLQLEIGGKGKAETAVQSLPFQITEEGKEDAIRSDGTKCIPKYGLLQDAQ